MLSRVVAPRWRSFSGMHACGTLASNLDNSGRTREFLCGPKTWYVSSAGRVRSSRGTTSYGCLRPSGYRVAQINFQNYYVHRLVASAFLGQPPSAEQWQVNHLDCCRSNNHLSNLEYATPRQNVQHSWAMRPRHHYRTNTVLGRMCGDENWLSFRSQAEAARFFGLSQRQVSKCCRRVVTECCSNSACYEFKFLPADRLAGELWEDAKYPRDSAITSVPGLMASSHGRVCFIIAETETHRMSSGYLRPDGYRVVWTAGRNLSVHRLVAATFLGQPQSEVMYVNHIDGNPGNNCLSNLEYASPSENRQHAHSLRQTKWQPRNGKPVQVRHERYQQSWQVFSSIQAAALHTGVSKYHIRTLCRGQKAPPSDWEFRFHVEESLQDEEWRPVVLEGARVIRP